MLGIMEEEEFTIESDKPLIIDEKPQVLSIKPKKRPQAKHSYSTRATIVETEPQVYYLNSFNYDYYKEKKILYFIIYLYQHFRKIDHHLTQKNLKKKMPIILMELVQMKKLNHHLILILVLVLNILIGWLIVVQILNHLSVLNIEDVE